MEKDSNLIYKYTPHNKCCKYNIIRHCELWFAEFSSLNDPLDLNLAFRQQYSDDEIMAYWERESRKNPKLDLENNLKKYGNNENFIKRQKKIFGQIKSRIGVLCMSKTPKNILMWAHYANGHKGIVYGFDENLFKDSESKALQKAPLPIKYDSEYKPLSYISLTQNNFKSKVIYLLKNIKDNELQFAESLFIKAKDWAYEEEVRFLNIGKSGVAINFNPASLNTIIFGANMLHGEIKKTISLCQDNHSLNHIHFQQAKFIDGRFELRFETINPKDFK